MSDQTATPKETAIKEIWISFDHDDGIDHHATQAEAIEQVGKNIESWREGCDPNWPEEVEAGLVAKITHVVDIISRHPADEAPEHAAGHTDFIDYGLVPVVSSQEAERPSDPPPEDAKATAEFAIRDALARTVNSTDIQAHRAEVAVRAILESILDPSTRWAFEKLLEDARAEDPVTEDERR